MRKLIWLSVVLGSGWLPGQASAEEAKTTNQILFSFAGPESFPINSSIAQLRASDIDQDGLLDIILVNNAQSKINILYNQTGKTNESQATPSRQLELNELPPDARFRIDSIASEKRIAALVVADLNGDQRADLAYFGEPKELVVQYNQVTNGWSVPKRWPVDDGQISPNALAYGDLNGDKRTDLVLLGERVLSFFPQQADGSLGEPEKIAFSGALKSVQVLDIDGNNRDDLLLVNWETPNPFRFRLQSQSGRLGPEIHFSMIPLRSYWADDLDGDRKTEIITIAMSSGRAQIGNFARKPSEALSGTFLQGQFQVLPLNKTSKSQRGQTWADVNQDERADLLVAEPDSGQLTLYLQQSDGALTEGQTFPALTGISEIAVDNLNPPMPVQVYVLSSEERQVGVSQFDKQGRLPFPTAIPFEGKPLALALGVPQPEAKAVLAVLLDRNGDRFLSTRQADAKIASQPLSDSFKSNPSRMMWHDANHDGLNDLVVLIPYEKIKILLQKPDLSFEEIDVAPPGGSLEQPWASAADVDGDGKMELLLGQQNFVRAVVLEEQDRAGQPNSWIFRVKDQINGASSNSRIVGAAPLKNGTNAVASLFMLDAERKALTLCERNTNDVWQVVRNVLLPVTDFSELRPVAFGQLEANRVGFLGNNAVAWMSLQGDIWEFDEIDGYETPIRDGRLSDVVSGDLNQDGRKDLVFLETAKNHLDLVIFDAKEGFLPATRWQVFESRTYRGSQGSRMEPREAMVEDVTGDGKKDLIILVHDRVLVYPQD